MCRGHQRLSECVHRLLRLNAADAAAVARLESLLYKVDCHDVLVLGTRVAIAPVTTSFPSSRRPGVHLVSSGLLQLTARTASATDNFIAFSRLRTLPPAWSQAPVVVTTSHQCYGSGTGCQSVSESCSRSRGSYISRSLEQVRVPRWRLPPTAVQFQRHAEAARAANTNILCPKKTRRD